MHHNSVLRQFGERVRRLRTGQSFSQEELGERSGSHRNYIGGIERGERNITITKLLALAAALDCDAADLITGIAARPSKRGRGT